MKFEQLIHTSAPAGIDGRPAGYVCVGMSQNIPLGLERKLCESSSMEDYFLDKKEPIRRLIILSVNKIPWVVLTNIKACGEDFTGRPNRIAHHLVAPLGSVELGDPVRIFSEFEFFDSWNRDPKILDSQEIKLSKQQPRVPTTWESLLGDPGIAGAVAKLAFPGKRPLWIKSKDEDPIELVSEISSLLPGLAAWKLTFSLSASREDTLGSSRCTLRFVPGRREEIIPKSAIVINQSFLNMLKDERYVLLSRKGEVFDKSNVEKKYTEFITPTSNKTINNKTESVEASTKIKKSNFIQKKSKLAWVHMSWSLLVIVLLLFLLSSHHKNYIRSIVASYEHDELVQLKKMKELTDNRISSISRELSLYKKEGSVEKVQRLKENNSYLNKQNEKLNLELETYSKEVEVLKNKVVSLEAKKSLKDEIGIQYKGPSFYEEKSIDNVLNTSKFVRVSYADLESGIDVTKVKNIEWHLGFHSESWEVVSNDGIGMFTCVNHKDNSQINLDCFIINKKFFLKIISEKDSWPTSVFDQSSPLFLVLKIDNYAFLIEGKEDRPAYYPNANEDNINSFLQNENICFMVNKKFNASLKYNSGLKMLFPGPYKMEQLLRLFVDEEKTVSFVAEIPENFLSTSMVLNKSINDLINMSDQNLKLTAYQLDYLRNVGNHDEFEEKLAVERSNEIRYELPEEIIIINKIPKNEMEFRDWFFYYFPIGWNK